MEPISVISLIIGILGLLLAIIQQIRIGSAKKKDFQRYWNLAKDAHFVLAEIERTKNALVKVNACPPEVLTSCGKAYGSSTLMVRKALENVFLQGTKFTDEQILHWKNSGLLSGYLLEAFDQMRLTPPRK